MEPKLQTAVTIEKQTAAREKKFIKSELEQDKVDIQVSRESDIKEVQNIFEEVKEEDDNDIFNSEEISNADRKIIIDLINRTNFIAILKTLLKNQMHQKWKLFILKKKKLRRKNKC